MTTRTVPDRPTGQALVNAYRKAGRTAYLLCFPDGRFIVRIN